MDQLTFLQENENSSYADDDVILYKSFFSTKHFVYFTKCLDELPWKKGKIEVWGKLHTTPRYEAWIGNKTYTYSRQILTPTNWTPCLLEMKKFIELKIGSKFNSVLANLYQDGSHYVGYHSDDEEELGNNPIIASVSLGGSRRFCFRKKNNHSEKGEILLNSGDLIIMKGNFQKDWQHCVPKTAKKVSPRINLTFRQIN
ncbi:MAG: alpha-ketoglutarate-dependent dioxygenase AlkB [Halobacteriovoraceae bacterium]|nr:alpha-ketoglutarate-dependent dioxygenase AlkB [Halobacteriovoraceae bacterium]